MKKNKTISLWAAVLAAFLIWVALHFVPAKSYNIEYYDAPCIKPHDNYNFKLCHMMITSIDGEITIIPKNFQTDLASLPRWYWPVVAPSYTPIIAPSILHDYLYRCPNNLTRNEVDDIFFYALLRNGASKYLAYKMYYGVRIFGNKYFNGGNYCAVLVKAEDTEDYKKFVAEEAEYNKE